MLHVGITVLFLSLALAVTDSTAQEGSFSWFACFLGNPSTDGAYFDGTHFGGPFRANGPVRVISDSPGRDDDPYFHYFTLSSDYYICDWGSAQATTPHPEGTELWIEPYEMMQQGPPWFELGAEEIPFGPDQVNWTEIRNAAQGGGLYLEEVANGARILLGSDSLYLKETMGGEVQEFCLSTLDEPVVWIENQPDDVVYIKGYPGREGLGRPLMVGMQGSVYLMGPQVYAEGSGAMLGLLAVHGQGVIADDPDDNSGYDWSSPWDIETMEDFTFSCSMMLLSGEFRAERYWEPSPQVELDLYGGVQIDHWGFTCTQYSGYDADVVYDERLFDESPPWYPSYEVQGVAESGSGIAAERRLEASSNPFAGSVTVSLPWGRSCRISVFDTAGRLVETASATESWTWNAHGLPAGMYVVRATAAGETASAKLLLLR